MSAAGGEVIPFRRDERVLPHNADAEASVLGGILLSNEVLRGLADLEVDDFFLMRHRVVFSAMRTLQHRGVPIDVVTLEVEIERAGKLESIGGVSALGELALRVPTADNVVAYAETVRRDAANRRGIAALTAALERAWRCPWEPQDMLSELAGELQRIDLRAAAKARLPWLRGTELADEIKRYANEPWVSLLLGGDELIRVRNGGLIVIMGGSGSGKSSLTLDLLVEHAIHVGPAIALSIELPADELGGRIVGQRCDASWEDALRGRVREEFVRDALDLPRLYVLEREQATLRNLERAVDAAREAYPGEPILVAIDYAQLIDSSEREVRMRVMDAFTRIDRVLRAKRVVGIAVSQMGRAGADAAMSGEKIGKETTSLGAESAAIERYATCTLTIGQMGEPNEEGASHVQLSLGKGRMLGGDRVYPMRYIGRTGRWRIAGEPKFAGQVREERSRSLDEGKRRTLELAITAFVAKATEPLSRKQIEAAVTGKGIAKREAIAALLDRGDLVEVARRQARSKAWLIWTAELASEAGISVVSDYESER